MLTWPVLALLPLSALALGAVHPWAFSLLEGVVFVTVGLWLGEVAAGWRGSAAGVDRRAKLVCGLGAMLVVLIGVQLLPLPPAWQRAIAPNTYQLHSQVLPGWPQQPVYRWVWQSQPKAGSQRYLLPSAEEVSRGARIPFAPAGAEAAHADHPSLAAGAWLPLSLAPRLTFGALLKFAACFFAGLLLMLYPVDDVETFVTSKRLVRVILTTGLVIGLVGLGEQIFSNGRPLGIFSPYDWRGGQPWFSRAYGPFANPDHFAAYLAMCWPFALAGLLFPSILGKVREKAAVPLLSGTVALVLLGALIATGSRGGWLAAAAATVILIGLVHLLPASRQPGLVRAAKGHTFLLISGAFGVLLLSTLIFTSSSSRTDAGARFVDALASQSLRERTQPARASLTMIRDFPVFGVGSGAWPELYRRYSPPPWSEIFMNAAHDDYVQFIAETGVLGLLLGASVIILAVSIVASGIGSMAPWAFPVAAACTAALTAIAVHSLLDFPLRTPAIALLAASYLGLLLRLASTRRGNLAPTGPARWPVRAIAGVGLLGLLVLLYWVPGQPPIPYPYDIRKPHTLSEAVDDVLIYPADSRVHLELAEILRQRQFSNDRVASELNAALELEPTNPLARDLLANSLTSAGHPEKALAETERSLTDAPSIEAHYYLSERLLPWLAPAERRAVINGLQAAATAGYPKAIDTLAWVYESFGLYQKEADFFVAIAARQQPPGRQAKLLTRAGLATARAGVAAHAAQLLEQAIKLDPSNPDAYCNLARLVYVPAKQFEQARAVLKQGIANGADPTPLYVALAEIEQQAGQNAQAEGALRKAVALQPYDFRLVRQLGITYRDDGKFDDAARWLRRVTQLIPQSGQAYFELAQAEDSGYQYSAAERDYARAVKLSPDNPGYASAYRDFKTKIAQNQNP